MVRMAFLKLDLEKVKFFLDGSPKMYTPLK